MMAETALVQVVAVVFDVHRTMASFSPFRLSIFICMFVIYRYKIFHQNNSAIV